ncbi:MAG TPA: DUF202 domain-containing protein [Vicinamibacterales bacterium]|jgi:putative membrane protein
MPTSLIPLDNASRLAVIRTRLAHERTLMAWVRTAISLISFGFTIYKAFQYLQDSQTVGFAGDAVGPRGFAIAMIGIALGALAIATYDHRQSLKAMREEFGIGVVPYSKTTIVAGLIAALGIVALFAVMLHL